MSAGFEVDSAALGLAARDLRAVLDRLDALGLLRGEVAPTQALDVSAADMGDEALAGLCADLHERAHYMLRTMVGDAQAMVTGLTDTRGAYQKAEDTVTDAFLRIMSDTAGDPLGGPPPASGGFTSRVLEVLGAHPDEGGGR